MQRPACRQRTNDDEFIVLAIDQTCDIYKSLEDVISLGCERVLTSGGKQTALEGATVIHKMIEQANERIIVMPG